MTPFHTRLMKWSASQYMAMVCIDFYSSDLPRKLIQIKGCSVKANILFTGGHLPVEDARELRKLAEWYRAFAEVGHSEHREGRLKLAAYLERKARELESRLPPLS
jgi:hypothetical protein